jgi:hypothetical protein
LNDPTASTGIALSIRQPWVELILAGRKTIEVRTWGTRHRGQLWLHAGRRVDHAACAENGIEAGRVTAGAIVGTVDLVDCIPFTAETWVSLGPKHLNSISFDSRYIGWVLRNPMRISRPVPYRGALGLMTLRIDAVPEVFRA